MSEPIEAEQRWEPTMAGLIAAMQRKWDEYAALRRLVFQRQQACAHAMEPAGEDSDEMPWEYCPKCQLRRPKLHFS